MDKLTAVAEVAGVSSTGRKSDILKRLINKLEENADQACVFVKALDSLWGTSGIKLYSLPNEPAVYYYKAIVSCLLTYYQIDGL